MDLVPATRAARPLALAAACTTLLALAACSSGSSDSTAPKSDAGAVKAATSGCSQAGAKHTALKGKKFTVGSSPGQNYYNTVDEKTPDTVTGLEPDLMAAIAACNGFSFTYQKQDFNGLVPAIAANRIDLITSGMYATPERAKQLSFVTYMKAAESAVTQSGNPKKITGLDTLCGTTVAQQVGTVEVEIAAKQDAACKAAGKPGITTINFTNNTQLTSALTGKRADVFLTDSGVAAYLAKQFKGQLDKGFDIVSDFKFGIGVGKENTELLSAVNDSMAALYASGDVAKIAQNWGFTKEQVVAPATVTG